METETHAAFMTIVSTGETPVADFGDGSSYSVEADSASVVELPEETPVVVLALKSSQCFSFHRSRQQMRRLRSRNLIAYELEEFLPVDGDDLAIGQIDTSTGSLIVAADGSQFRSTTDWVDRHGVHVVAIAPIVLLAITELARQQSLGGIGLVVWHSEEGIDLVRLDRGKPVEWRWCKATTTSLQSTFDEMHGEDSELGLLWVDVPRPLMEVAELEESQLHELSLPRDLSASIQCDRISRGLAKPLIDLRSGPLESTDPFRPIASSLRVFLAAIVLMQLALLGAVLFRSWQYREEGRERFATQEEAFTRVFPGEPIPVGIVSRLQSEHRRLAGTRGTSGQKTPKLRSAIPITHVFLSAIPEPSDARFTIERLEFEPERIKLAAGTAKSYGDLETIAERLRRAGLVVPPVSASKNSDGVTLRFEELGLKGKSTK